MEAQKRNTILIALVAIVAVVVLVLGILFFFGGGTYVRIVDTSAERALDGAAPGADIDAVAIEKWVDGERKNVWYAESVEQDPYAVPETTDSGEDASTAEGEPVDAEASEESETTVNEKYTDAQAALGDPEAEETTRFIALNGKELIVQVPKRLRKGMTLVVHEVGAVNAVRADSYEVYTSRKADGPWELRGTGSGPFSVEITE